MTYKRILSASFLMILTYVCLRCVISPKDIKPVKPLSAFPRQIEDWIGEEGRFDDKIYEVLGVDDSFLCDYSRPDGRRVQLYIGYYYSQREGELIHSPKNCMPGAGWSIIRSSLEELKIPCKTNDRKIKVVKLLLKKGLERQIVLYWFQSRGRFIVSEYMQKIYLVIDSITRRRTDGSFVRITASVKEKNEDTAMNDLKGFAERIIPVLQEFIPS